VVTIRPADPGEIDLLCEIDDDASRLYAVSGLDVNLKSDDAFIVAERARWLDSTRRGDAFLAVDGDGLGVGFAALGKADGLPYLDQLSVRMAVMRRGIGRLLLGRALEWAAHHGGDALWLTTWDHLPFNRPFYERHGFQVVPEAQCGPDVQYHLAEERQWLPDPDRRIAMRRPL
jgi:GNAT superfamily N-acetyltransferase